MSDILNPAQFNGACMFVIHVGEPDNIEMIAASYVQPGAGGKNQSLPALSSCSCPSNFRRCFNDLEWEKSEQI